MSNLKIDNNHCKDLIHLPELNSLDLSSNLIDDEGLRIICLYFKSTTLCGNESKVKYIELIYFFNVDFWIYLII
jgi:hypothetical protein